MEALKTTSWHSYPSIFAVGHRAAAELFEGPVTIEEKVDGSQFSFGVFDGQIKCRSKGQQLIVDAPEQLFTRAVESVKKRAHLLRDGWTYRAEYLQKPKHNTLGYSRIPEDHLIIFDVCPAEETYLPWEQKAEEAFRIGLEVVPLLYAGEIASADELARFLDRESVLGGAKIEGFVVKNYAKFGPDKKVLLGKFVSEAFKEAHGVQWKVSNPNSKDVVQAIIESYKTDARWQKAVGHLRDAGTLQQSPRDIAALIKEVQADVFRECENEIRDALMKWARPQITRGIVAGLPEWYKGKLMADAFEPSPSPESTREG